ncbi:cellulose biosynthesis cyclic di-GMP-binding regulatory protein BcsB [Shigella flexneri]
MANAAPDNAATTPAPNVPVVAQVTDPVVTAAPADGKRRPEFSDDGQDAADNPVVGAGHARRAGGQCAGGCRKYAVVAASSRKLTFAQIAPPPGSMVLRGINPNGGIEFGMRSDEVVSKAVNL